MIVEYMYQSTPLSAVLTAIILLPLVPLIHVMLMRFSKGKKRLLFMLLSFVFYGILWFLLGFYLNDYSPVSISFLTAGISIIAFLCIGYARFFILVCYSITFRIILDVYLRGSLTPDQLIEGYGGKGMDWLLERRIEAMQSWGMAKVSGDMLESRSPKGTFIGKAGLLIKKVLNMGEGG